MYFSYEHLNFRYEPFPIGLAKPVMDESVYQELVDNYPAIEQVLEQIAPYYKEKLNGFIAPHPGGHHHINQGHPGSGIGRMARGFN